MRASSCNKRSTSSPQTLLISLGEMRPVEKGIYSSTARIEWTLSPSSLWMRQATSSCTMKLGDGVYLLSL